MTDELKICFSLNDNKNYEKKKYTVVLRHQEDMDLWKLGIRHLQETNHEKVCPDSNDHWAEKIINHKTASFVKCDNQHLDKNKLYWQCLVDLWSLS